jgi:hypothetical protein
MLINLVIITDKKSISGIYLTIDFNVYLLSESTILDNRAAVHLVNDKLLLKLETFKKAQTMRTVEARSTSF